MLTTRRTNEQTNANKHPDACTLNTLPDYRRSPAQNVSFFLYGLALRTYPVYTYITWLMLTGLFVRLVVAIAVVAVAVAVTATVVLVGGYSK